MPISKKTLWVVFPLLLLTFCHPARMHNYEVHGIDISRYQEDIDWQKVTEDSITYVYIKATEGELYKDASFAKSWKSATKAGLIRGAYHYFQPNTSAEAQAKNFISTVKLEAGDLPPVLDVEVNGGLSKKELVRYVRRWLENVENHYKIKPIIYTNLSFYKDYFKGEFENYDYWIAHYQDFQKRVAPQLGDKRWVMWQYTDRGRVYGIDGNVDLNVFNGSLEELRKLCVGGKAWSPIIRQPSAPTLPQPYTLIK